MADTADNKNQGASGGGERRAALRSDETGSSFTRVRQTGYPMRKASTLPDLTGYSSPEEDRHGGASRVDRSTTDDAGASSPVPPAQEHQTDMGDTRAGFDDAVGHHDAAGHDGAAGRDDADTHTDSRGPEEHATHDDSDEPPVRIDAAATEDGSTRLVPADARTINSNEHTDNSNGHTKRPDDARTAAIAVTGNTAGSSPTNDASTTSNPHDARTAAIAVTGSDDVSPTANQTRQTPGDDPAPDTQTLSIRPPEEDVSRRASQRDEAAAAKPILPRILQVVVAVFFPVILLAAAVRAVTTPLFLLIEYHRPGFPADEYGFSTEDRMTYGSYAMDYIVNWAPARYLGDLVNTDGQPLFLDSEVGHMADVKLVLSTGFVVATVLALIAIGACIYLARRYPGGIRRALFAGAAATLILAVVLAVVAVLAWESFFTQVHALFFADGTWTFRLDDTLIRLFPAQFWIDAAGAVGALVLIGAGLTLALTWPTRTRRDRSARAYAARRAHSGM